MKTTSQPHDPLDELLAAAVHGELTAAQRAELDALLQHDPAARAAYQEIQTMHDLLEKNHREVKPDPDFEDRMISGVKRKVRDEAQRETPWESALVLWRGLRAFWGRPSWKSYAGALAIILILAGVALGPITHGIKKAQGTTVRRELLSQNEIEKQDNAIEDMVTSAQPVLPTAPAPRASDGEDLKSRRATSLAPFRSSVAMPSPTAAAVEAQASQLAVASTEPASTMITSRTDTPSANRRLRDLDFTFKDKALARDSRHAPELVDAQEKVTDSGAAGISANADTTRGATESKSSVAATSEPTRKLVRDATLDLEVKAYQPTVDTITDLAKTNGGYLDSSSSQRGGNGKLQGTVVAKVAPEKLDAFLLKLRELGTLKNQSVSTEDVTKDYVDTQARLNTSRQMETQLQALLKRDTSKVADLLQVERELGRVRGEIEQMQGQLKLYDFQVQYATVTISVAEKDLNKAAAYLLQERDQFALFVRDVEGAFAQAKTAADTYKAQILNADLEHGSDNTMSATLAFSVPPEQVDAFLAKVKALGRVDNFTRTTTRVANDGGDSDEPADETRTDKDRVQVQLTIRADDESPRQQTELAIASTGDIDRQAQQLKDDAAASGAAVTASSFERETDGTETATITFRLELAKVGEFMPTLEKLGRVESLSVHRDDRAGQAVADANGPAEIDLRLHNVAAASIETQPPRQQTQLAVISTGNVDAQAQQVKSDALESGVNVTGSTFSHSPDGSEEAALTFRLPLAQAANFTAALEKLGRIESLAIQRNDVTGPASTDPNAPAGISLTLRSEPAVVAENRGVGPTLRHLFGGGVTAFLHSVETVGVLAAFLAPWLAAVAVVAFVARRVWVMRYTARAR